MLLTKNIVGLIRNKPTSIMLVRCCFARLIRGSEGRMKNRAVENLHRGKIITGGNQW